MPDTQIEIANKAIDEIAWGDRKPNPKAIPFGGTIDPYKPITDAEPNLPDWMEKRGQASPVVSPTTHLRPFTWVEAAKQLRSQLGKEWTAECFAELKQLYPENVPQEAMDDLLKHFTNKGKDGSKSKPTLRVIGGH